MAVILAGMKYDKQDDEQRNVGHLKNLQKGLMGGDDAAPCTRVTLRLFERLEYTDNASDQQHKTGDVENIDD